MRGCVSLGWNLKAGFGIQQDEEAANEVFQQAGDGGSARGCAQIGVNAIELHTSMPDGSSPADAIREGCNERSVAACAGRGLTYLRGVGVQQDLNYGVALLKKACNETTSPGCR